MKPETWILIGSIVAAVVIVWIAVCLIISWNRHRKGIDGTLRVRSILRRFAGIRSFKVLSGLTFSQKNRTVCVDHILIGFFGIMLITVKNAKGTVYGSGRDKNWVRVITKHEQEKRGTFANPVFQNQSAVEAVREILASQNIYKIPIENYIVFANKKAVLNTERGLPVLTIRDFKKLLKKEKYSADGDVDVAKISDVLTNAAVPSQAK